MTYSCIFIVITLLFVCYPVIGFNVGVKGTKCSLLQATFNDPCRSLYGAVCDGAHCRCPPGTLEEKLLNRCSRDKSPKGRNGFDDLPFDYIPGAKNDHGKILKYKTTARPNPLPTSYPVYPKTPGYPQQPGYLPRPEYPGSQPRNPNKSGIYKQIIFPDNSNYGRTDSSGRNINSILTKRPNNTGHNSGLYPNQSGYNPNKPNLSAGTGVNNLDNYQTSIGSYGHRHNHRNNIGGRTGGGIGGLLGLILFVALIYFCCCRGEKGRSMRGKLPFGGGGGVAMNQPGVTYQMQQAPIQPVSQQIYVPQQPNPQVYIPQQPGQVYVPQPPAGQMYNPQPQPPVIGFVSPPPPYSAEYQATAPPPTA